MRIDRIVMLRRPSTATPARQVLIVRTAGLVRACQERAYRDQLAERILARLSATQFDRRDSIHRRGGEAVE